MNAIVIGQPSALRDGLIALLYTLPEIKVVSSTEHRVSAMEFIEARSASLVLFQVDTTGQGWGAWIRTLKNRAPKVRMLALVAESSLRSRYLDAGVDTVLVQGASTTKLREAISAQIATP